MSALAFVAHWLLASFAMVWQVLWSLILGFMISAMIQAYVPKAGLSKVLGRAGLRELAIAAGAGAASSSCSYAAAATAKSLFKRGADFTVAMVFMFASTNLVIELGLVLWRLVGWPFVAAEWLGGFILMAVFVVLSKLLLSKRAVESGRAHVAAAEASGNGHEHDHGHGEMLAPGATLLDKLRSATGWTYVAHYFDMDWSMLRSDLVLGFLIAGLLAVAVPPAWWQHLYITSAPPLARTIENALVGPIVAVVSFVCSIGNVPLAAVLWSGGSTFGGVIAFLYADLIVLPLVDVYRRYYGWGLALRTTGIFYLSMVIAGLIVELIFSAFGAIPRPQPGFVMRMENISLNATTVLNFIFIALALLLVWRGRRTPHAAHAHD
jgi:uncharacterized membrane protein YraQ (UPF0718 family)